MRKIYFILIVIELFAMGCDKLHKLTQFPIDVSSNYTVPGVNDPLLITNAINVAVPPTATNSTAVFSSKNTESNLIESIKLKKLNLTSTNGVDLSFLNEVRLYIQTSTQPEVEIAYKTNIGDGIGTSLDLNTNDVELKEYLKSDSITLRAYIKADKIFPSTDLKINQQYLVDAKILGF